MFPFRYVDHRFEEQERGFSNVTMKWDSTKTDTENRISIGTNVTGIHPTDIENRSSIGLKWKICFIGKGKCQ